MEDDDKQAVNIAVSTLQTESLLFANRFIKDATVRQNYIRLTTQASVEMRQQIALKKLTPAEAAAQATNMRNEIMARARATSSDIGLAKAQKLKATPKSVEDLAKHYAQKKYQLPFTQLPQAKRDAVFLEIVESSGRANVQVNAKVLQTLRYGRALGVATAGVAIYNIAQAEDKPRAIVREGAILGAGFASGAAGGAAAAGLLCGPGAPFCVTLGVLVGGALGAIGADCAFERAAL